LGQESIVVPPARRMSGAPSSPNDSVPRTTSLALMVVIGRSALSSRLVRKMGSAEFLKFGGDAIM
jgi:hypothetical protein